MFLALGQVKFKLAPLECAVRFVPVEMSQTDMEGAMDGARQEANSGADCEPATAGEVGVANGKTLPQACKEVEIVEQNVLPVAKGVRRVKVDQVPRLKELEQENAKLSRVASDFSLEKLVLKDIASGSSKP
jgi:putative transposase